MPFAAVLTDANDVVDGARSRHRGAIGWFVGDGEITRCFSALQRMTLMA
jgi:hypothetical protein